MEKYLVGGAVRNLLLKLPVKEKDWVITGSSPQEMLKIGYEQVGKSFPVFLHPISHEEYALARTERKSGKGYTGFVFCTEPSVTIEEDLYRRDLTINAMAYDIRGNLLDPYNGQQDIKLRLLRHVSSAFHEDPLRVLRVARFAAQFKNLGFNIASETLNLMKHMTQELDSLSIERVWMETKKALLTDSPHIYFQVLHQCQALKILFPTINTLFKISHKCKQWNVDANTIGDFTMMKLSKIATITDNLAVRFSILCSEFKWITTIVKKTFSDYEQNCFKTLLINSFCNKLKVPHNIFKFTKIVSVYCDHLYDFTTLSPKMLMEIFKAFDCWRVPNRIKQIIYINKSNLFKIKDLDYLNFQEKFLYSAFEITTHVKVHDIIEDGFIGSNINKELYVRRLYRLNIWRKKFFKLIN